VLLGPGLILGGALSFAIFQVVGRGVVGVVITTLAGLGSVGLLMRSAAPEVAIEPRWWMLGQLVGMGAMVIASEFEALLPVAIVSFVLGCIAEPSRRHSQKLVVISCVVGITALVTISTLRRADWWVVTDDYFLLETVARHITIEGPFSTWGLTSYSRYHWLSYGWSGLLDLFALNPGPLVTLTRVMPIVYAMSLASSVSLIGRRVMLDAEPRATSLPWFLLVWAVLSIGRFEWTGTSTGGAYAIVAAVISVGLLIDVRRIPSIRHASLLAGFFIIAILTKVPTLFAMGLIILALLALRLSGSMPNHVAKLLVGAVTLTIAILVTFAAIWFFGRVTDRIHFARVNPGLGQLSEFGRLFAGTVLLLSQAWLWFALALTGLHISRQKSARQSDHTFWLLPIGFISLPSAWLLELSLSGTTNTYTYFSGPMYFVGSLVLLYLGYQSQASSNFPRARRVEITLVLGVFCAGLIWGASWSVHSFWEAVISTLPTAQTGGVELLKFFTRDLRFGATLTALALLIGSWRLPRFRKKVAEAWIVALIPLAFAVFLKPAIADFEFSPTKLSAPPSASSQAIYETGKWIRTETSSRDLFATNYAFEDTGGSMMELELSTWSQREFLVLGPQITGQGETWTTEETRARNTAKEVSESFSHEPSDSSCRQLREYGVKWYVVDTSKTNNRDWSVCSSVTFSYENFIVLSLNEFMK
jgi:hypothetical protein